MDSLMKLIPFSPCVSCSDCVSQSSFHFGLNKVALNIAGYVFMHITK